MKKLAKNKKLTAAPAPAPDELFVRRWAAANAAAAGHIVWAQERQRLAAAELRLRGAALAAEQPAIAGGCRGFQLESPYADPYLVGMDADTDRFSPEELAEMNSPRAPRFWLPDGEDA